MNQGQPNHASFPSREEFDAVIPLVAREAAAYLRSLDDRPVRSQRLHDHLKTFDSPLPETGEGAAAALDLLIREGMDAAVATAGPRSFHFVIGGSAPAALGADWLASTLDQAAYAWVSSPLATHLELLSLQWLQDLFGLPADWQGVMTTGATMANLVCLASARQWAGEQMGVDIAEHGLAGQAPIPVFSSGIIHPSDVKALSMLGLGRSSVQRLVADEAGSFDVAGLERALQQLDGAPAIIIAVAGEPNAGMFDPIAALADLADHYNGWLHVDGAFGLFASVSPDTAHLVAGTDRALSVAVDGHKWLNVPYDTGFAFVSDAALMAKSFTHSAAYLPDPTAPEPVLGSLAPEMSRRARSLTVWAMLKAYGRQGVRRIVEDGLARARYLGQIVEAAPDLELLADVVLNVVCFRYNPGGLQEGALSALNERLGQALIDDGRVFVGTTTYEGKVALRPAMVNWMTRDADIDFFAATVRELGAAVAQERIGA